MEEDTTRLGRLWDRLVARRLRWAGITAYPFQSAMYGAVQWWTRWGAVTVSWPWLGRTWAATGLGPSLWVSPNATPWAATLLVGGRWTALERHATRERRRNWGHGYDLTTHDPLGR